MKAHNSQSATRNFYNITLADFNVRAAYQMGKTPLLPLYAAALGATDAFLGFIVSVSTLTGMVLKPGIGILSDRWGRRWWLLLGTAFFAFVPFLYTWIETPAQLFILRIIHGTATAIYGPVTLAFVAEQTKDRRAEQLGWFGMARSAGYVVGPAIAGWLLLVIDPATVFTLIGLASCLAFIPIFQLTESQQYARTHQISLLQQIRAALHSGGRTPAVWLSGGLESATYIALYAVRTFLPIYALSIGISVAWVGTFFSVQEGVHMLLKPGGGRLGDRLGYMTAIRLGMIGIGFTLPLLGMAQNVVTLFVLAMLIGASQALVFPSTVALVSTQIQQQHVGAGMGIIGTLRNLGKVAGPIVGGILLARLDYAPMFQAMGLALLLGAFLLWIWARQHEQQESPQTVQSGAD